MKPKTKLFLTLTTISLVTLACATLMGNDNPGQTDPVVELPTNTPLPPLPTSTPVPQDPAPTEDTSSSQAQGGEVLFFDDFSDPSSGWDRYSDSEGITDYEDGAYKIGVNKDTYFYWANPYQSFGDQIIDVVATVLTAETDNQYGIVCRHQDVDNWYALVISGDGYAAIRKRYQGENLETITDWVAVDAINQGQATNNIHAECVGDRLTLYVNGTLAIETFDADIPAGDAGLISGTFDAPSIEVLFDNFQVSAP